MNNNEDPGLVIYVDADEEARRKFHFTFASCNVKLCENTRSALDRVRSDPDSVAVVIVDSHVAAKGVEAFAREVSRLARDALVAVMAKDGELREIAGAVNAGVLSRVLVKPVASGELRSAIAAGLADHEARQRHRRMAAASVCEEVMRRQSATVVPALLCAVGALCWGQDVPTLIEREPWVMQGIKDWVSDGARCTPYGAVEEPGPGVEEQALAAWVENAGGLRGLLGQSRGRALGAAPTAEAVGRCLEEAGAIVDGLQATVGELPGQGLLAAWCQLIVQRVQAPIYAHVRTPRSGGDGVLAAMRGRSLLLDRAPGDLLQRAEYIRCYPLYAGARCLAMKLTMEIDVRRTVMVLHETANGPPRLRTTLGGDLYEVENIVRSAFERG